MIRPIPFIGRCAAPLAFALVLPATVAAQEAGDARPEASLAIELNAAAAADPSGCRLTFLVENGLGADLSALSLETAILTTDGQVERLTLFDFGALPDGRPRVRQFDLPDLACDAVEGVLVNDVAACEGPGAGACMDGLHLSSRIDARLLG